MATTVTAHTSTHDGHAITVTVEDRGMFSGYYAPVTVDGLPIGEVVGMRREEDGKLTVRFSLINGYDKIKVWSEDSYTMKEAISERAEAILAYYRRAYPLAK